MHFLLGSWVSGEDGTSTHSLEDSPRRLFEPRLGRAEGQHLGNKNRASSFQDRSALGIRGRRVTTLFSYESLGENDDSSKSAIVP